MTYLLECTHLSKSYNGVPVLRQVNLAARAGQLMALLGPSGCGKTTTLRLIAGFEWPDSGTISIKGRVVASETVRVPAEERRVGMVFQEYALFPHLDVAGNIAFGLRGAEKQQRVADMLALVGLQDFAKRMPHELSGGQQQRIALARALAPQPDVLLLDEPFSNLDTALRAQVRSEVRAILKQSGITAIFVTHDQEEALSLADVVAVMMDGHIAQVAEPQQLYHQPASREVAAFVGEANFLPGEARGNTVSTILGELMLAKPAQGRVEVLIRPEALRLDTNRVGGGVKPSPTARILWREFYGHDQRIGLTLADGTTVVARADSALIFAEGDAVHVSVTAPVRAFPR